MLTIEVDHKSAAAAYAPGFVGATYVQVGSAMMTLYLASGMTMARWPYRCPCSKCVLLRMVNVPPSLFSRSSIDSGVMIPVIFVMASFCDASISSAPFWDNLVDIDPTLLMEKEGGCVWSRDGR